MVSQHPATKELREIKKKKFQFMRILRTLKNLEKLNICNKILKNKEFQLCHLMSPPVKKP